MEHIVFLDRGSLPIKLPSPRFPHSWEDHAYTTEADVLERAKNATIVITNKTPLREAVLSKLPGLKLIAVAATGTDVVDTEYCRKHGITVTNVNGYANTSLAEHVFMMILALRRNLMAYRESVSSGKWQRSRQFCLLDHPIGDLHGSVLGVIGYGSLGQAVANMGRQLGMRILVAKNEKGQTDRGSEILRIPLNELLEQSDVVSLHLPLTAETKELIGLEQLKIMKSSALLINTARGGLVNPDALVYALKNKVIAGAGFDVLNIEPPHSNDPFLNLRLPNFILTPHVAWASDSAMKNLADQLIENIEIIFKTTNAFSVGTSISSCSIPEQ